MTYEKGMNLDDVIGKYDILSAQKFLDDMPYDFETADDPRKYCIRSPKKTLERGSAMCIDGALLGAALTGMQPNILALYFAYANCSHAVLIVQDNETKKFGAIGKSRRPDLTGRDCIYDNLKDLALSYNNKRPAIAYSSLHWDSPFPAWMTTNKDMYSKFCIWPKKKKTQKFSIHYYLDYLLKLKV